MLRGNHREEKESQTLQRNASLKLVRFIKKENEKCHRPVLGKRPRWKSYNCCMFGTIVAG